MKEMILEALNYTFKYEPEAKKNFFSTLAVRYGEDSEFFKTVKKVLNSKVSAKQNLTQENVKLVVELKRLNLMGIKERLNFIDKRGIKETVVISYLRLLQKEIEHPNLCSPSQELLNAEETMLNYLLEEAIYNEDLTELQGISNKNLRLVMQTWLLHPDLPKQPDKTKEILKCMYISNCSF